MQPQLVELDLTDLLNNPDQKQLVNALKKLAGESWYFQELNKRSFHNPKGYVSYTSLLTEMAFNLISADNVPIAAMDYTTLNGSILLREIVENCATTFPCYWLNSNLLSAFLKTDLPDVMGMKRSHQYGTIFFPSGMIKSPDGYSVNWIIFAHRLKDEVSTIQLQKPQRIFNTYPEDMLQIFTAVGDATLYFSGCSLERTNEKKLPYRESSLSGSEEEFINKLLSIAIQCLLWLQIYTPKESTPSGVGFKSFSTSSNRAQNPRWIGWNYQPKTATIPEKTNNSFTHPNRKSPVQHERRGHWRSQRVGAGRSHIKTIWIEPHLVGQKYVET
ncbi:hypothetical protein ACE1CI_03260 [Aerosakkonemataceae cyanobacterium BLCC-F50]|uniref:Uncharacterized protein n=1 Tax=Floridaenema flaviceps BLCC-F50 TaxID=3153642 RepID=A0ABV4XJQ8_9CYAN